MDGSENPGEVIKQLQDPLPDVRHTKRQAPRNNNEKHALWDDVEGGRKESKTLCVS